EFGVNEESGLQASSTGPSAQYSCLQSALFNGLQVTYALVCSSPTPTATAASTATATATNTPTATATATATFAPTATATATSAGTATPTPTCAPSAFHVLIAY